MPGLPYDVIIPIMGCLFNDYDYGANYSTLYQCSLVNRALHNAATPFLYRCVTYSAVHTPLSLSRRDPLSEGYFAAARLPHNATLVQRLEICNLYTQRLNQFSSRLKAAVECWPNLRTVVFTPRTQQDHLFDDALPLLLQLPYLESFTCDPACGSELNAQTLSQLRNLKSLTIETPKRVILQLLPELLRDLKPTLRTLSLTGNCGSITPGVLRSFVPHMTDIAAFSFGLSYSLTHDDVFEILEGLPNLTSLTFFYYLQMRPYRAPYLPHFRDLTVQCVSPSTRSEAAYFYKWVRRVIRHGPLRKLHVEFPIPSAMRGASPSFSPLLEHLCARHAATLQVCALKSLCSTCVLLEELSVLVSLDVARRLLPEYIENLPRLHALHIDILGKHKTRRENSTLEAAQVFFDRNRTLRRVSINKERYTVTIPLHVRSVLA
ncbi:uncharacterized protein BXZ73DRAFT_92472 [Epithele typhae]|uniref:uncharacterized protein n=1 Tax=Epithele typhae TaxID=378194 RepID=UPI0020072B0A|nr:uncharacterized protein BXZ73DRAFT_92472 [Epithele typhae]KAH9916577.1 hypothetical protein BXZ73DRAFT_92472 [Epithele typhae]